MLKWWAVAIFLGGGILMRLLINLYDRVSGNPKSVYGGLEGERGAQTSSHVVDIIFIVVGIGLVITAVINTLKI